jgi:glycerophosphoryl diester phosphodiesterase
MPSSPSRRAELRRLGEKPFAHRGLHGSGRPENSRAAFEAAIAAGSGIELDVQGSRDGEAMVFHDDRLDRLTIAQGLLRELSAGELGALRLADTSETIPSLAGVLRLIEGRVPLLIEVKSAHRRVAPLCQAVAAALEDYRGAMGVMSFNPEVGAWFARRAPDRLRGLIVTEGGKAGWRGRIERSLAFARARADFLAYDVRDLPSAFAAAKRAVGVPVYTWTVRSAADRARAEACADQIIYEDVADG